MLEEAVSKSDPGGVRSSSPSMPAAITSGFSSAGMLGPTLLEWLTLLLLLLLDILSKKVLLKVGLGFNLNKLSAIDCDR